MLRGIERRHLFYDECDNRDLLARLNRILPESGMSCYAWALMPNHVHLVLRTGRVPLRQVMARVNTGYAKAFNLRHDRVGHLFQNRYKSLLVTSDAQILALVRYVHLNPVRARLVDTLDALGGYPWTGHASLLGDRPELFQDTSSILAQFGGRMAESRRRLLDWMRTEAEPTPGRSVRPCPAEADSSEPSAAKRGSGPVRNDLDDADGIDTSSGIDSEARPRHRELVALVRHVCARRGVAEGTILGSSRSRCVSAARAEIAHRACTELLLSGATVARMLGLSKAAVSQARVRGRVLLASERDPSLREN
jgi:REP element-mobilizing transposase RayT